MSKIKRLRAVLSGAVASALAVTMLPVLATTATAATDPLGGQPGPVTLSPTMGQDGWQPNPPAGTTVDDFMRHPVLSWTAISSLPVTQYRVQISPNANFTNNTVSLPNGGLTKSTQYDLPQTLPHASYFWRVRGEDGAGHATNWAGTSEGDTTSNWQFTKTWADWPVGLSPATGPTSAMTYSWSPLPDASAYQFEASINAGFPANAKPTWADMGACDLPCTLASWSSAIPYPAGASVLFNGDKWTANKANTNEVPSVPTLTTFSCTTNNASFSPYAAGDGLSLVEGAVEGTCGDPAAFVQALRLGGAWYWHVRGLDSTSAALTAASTGVTCLANGADCSGWSDVQKLSYPFASAPGGPSAAVTGLQINCPDMVAGSTLPLCYQTPTLSWTATPGADAYAIEVSPDPMFTTEYRSYTVFSNSLTPRDDYHDNQAGASYYWRIRPCTYDFSAAAASCRGTSDQGVYWAFHKVSVPLPKSPAGAAAVTGHNGLYVTVDNNETFQGAVKTVRTQQMTFHWDDLLQYEQQAGVAATQEAKEYRLQYSTTGNWLDDTTTTTVLTDATHWTKLDGSLADGGYYWRVAPVDGSGNLLSWSAVQTVVKGTVSPSVSIADSGLLAPTSAVTLQFQAPVSGVSSASLGLKRVGGGIIPGHIVWPAPTPSLATFTPDKPLLPGDKVVPWVTSAVVDLAGNPARASTATSTVDPTVDSAAAVITASWSKISTGHASGGSYAKAAGARDQIDFSFSGSAVKLVGVRTTDGGYGLVSVDGVPRKTVNFHAGKTAYGVVLYSALLSEGHHVVSVTVKGSHPKSSKGNAVNVDALKVDGRTLQQSSASQHWARHRSTDAFNGSYDAEASFITTWHGSKPTLATTFAGKAVHVVGCKSPDGGKYGVYVDGKLKATGDAFQKFTSCNKVLVRVNGLSAGSHKVTVALLGTHSKVSTGTKVSVDAIVAG
ncbi:MAG: large repetitive protein [Frankiales bacterium]|nr:large repetitive protein [Frankiales bacterium]